MRLESDDDRVRIVTVHSSKGLEYPVVFLPFAWSGGLRVTQREQFVFHDSEAGNQATVEFGSEDFEQNLASACRASYTQGRVTTLLPVAASSMLRSSTTAAISGRNGVGL